MTNRGISSLVTIILVVVVVLAGGLMIRHSSLKEVRTSFADQDCGTCICVTGQISEDQPIYQCAEDLDPEVDQVSRCYCGRFLRQVNPERVPGLEGVAGMEIEATPTIDLSKSDSDLLARCTKEEYVKWGREDLEWYQSDDFRLATVRVMDRDDLVGYSAEDLELVPEELRAGTPTCRAFYLSQKNDGESDAIEKYYVDGGSFGEEFIDLDEVSHGNYDLYVKRGGAIRP